MTTEITIFDIPDQEPTSNKSQKQLEYEELELASGLNSVTVWSMYEMDELLNNDQIPVSSLTAVMLNYILKYVVAIVIDSPMAVTSKPNAQSQYYLTLQCDNLTYCIKNGNPMIIPANHQFNVAGIILPDVFIKYYDKYVLHHYDHISDKDIALSGHFGLRDQQSMKFTQQRESMTQPGSPNINGTTIMFSSDAECTKLFAKIIRYVSYIHTFYNSYFPLINLDLYKPDILNSSYVKWKVQYSGKPFDENILKLLSKAQAATFGDSFTYENLYLLTMNRLERLYNVASILGTDSDLFKKDYITAQKSVEKYNNYLKHLNQSYQVQLEITLRRTISYDKFGIYNYDLLTAEQKKIVNIVYDKSIDKIGHPKKDVNAQLFKSLRESMLNQTSHDMNKIIKQIENANSAKDLSGNVILADGACPHLYNEAIKLRDIFGKPHANIEIRNFLINDYAFPADTNGYFCKICGEKIAEVDNTAIMKFNGDRSGINFEDSPIQTIIWKEAMYIISTNVRFTTPIPIKPLVNSLAYGLKEIVSHEEAKLYRVKTNTNDNIKDLLNLYSAIYIYASLCALMMINPGKLVFARDPPVDRKKKIEPGSDGPIVLDDAPAEAPAEAPPAVEGGTRKKFKYKKGGAVITDSKMAEKIYITTALKLLFISKDSLISRLSNMSPDFIKQIFIKNAYSWALKYIRPIQVEHETQSQILENTILNDSFYRYLVYAQRLSGKKVDFKDIKRVLGRDEKAIFDDLKEDIGMFKTVEDIKPWHFDSPKPKFDEYTYRSFMMMLDYHRESVHNKCFIPRHAQVTEYFDKYKDLLVLEKQIWYEMSKIKAIPTLKLNNHVNLVRKYNNFSPNIIDLAQHYCPTGERHKIGVYVYKNGTKTIEISKKEINDWLSQKDTENLEKYESMVLIDEKCEKCGEYVRAAKSAKKSASALINMFSKIDDITAFYQYYESRCPKGNLHEMVKEVCNVCGFQTELSRARDLKYYDKYKASFYEIQKEKKTLTIKSLDRVALKREVPKVNKIDYKYSLKNTAEWSQITGVNYNLLINIGLYNDVKYTDLEASSINPSKTAGFSHSRALRFKTHILRIVREYSTMINYDKVIDIPLWTKELIDEQKKVHISDIRKSMPEINDFVELDEKYVYSLNVENYTNFLQEYLAGIIVRINNKRADKYKTLADGAVKYFTTTILEYERMLSKPEPVFVDAYIEENSASDTASESGDELMNDISKENEEEAAETYENDLDLDGFDVEDEADVWDVED
jgi:hypothetical protein